MSEPPRNILQEIHRYVPGGTCQNSDHGYERLTIQLLGFLGHGKSSLINSVRCVVKGTEYQNVAGSGNISEGKTKKRHSYDLTDTINITDNRGFSKMNDQEILEATAQLRHLRPVGEVEWKKDNAEETLSKIPESYKCPKEFLVPVIVHSGLHSVPVADMSKLVTKCHEIIGLHPIVVITRAEGQNSSAENAANIEDKFRDLGITHLVSLDNYTEKNQRRTSEADNAFLTFLDMCMTEAERVIRGRGNQDYPQVFATNVANQVREEKKLSDAQWQERVRKLEEESAKKWKCSIL